MPYETMFSIGVAPREVHAALLCAPLDVRHAGQALHGFFQKIRALPASELLSLLVGS